MVGTAATLGCHSEKNAKSFFNHQINIEQHLGKESDVENYQNNVEVVDLFDCYRFPPARLEATLLVTTNLEKSSQCTENLEMALSKLSFKRPWK